MSIFTMSGRDAARPANWCSRPRVGSCVAWLTAALVVTGAQAQTASPPAPVAATSAVNPPHRPRIGLVLGGGGAKGAAHVGVIKVLEEMHVPIDCIIGTSMGALVGGTYATGMDAEELDEAINGISWAETIGSEGRRVKLPMRRKLAGRTYSNNLEFGFRDGGVAAPRGIINSQYIEQTIRYLVAPNLATDRFDDLPIPFRAVATDMLSGEMVVLDHGNLAQAMRASMAVPGIFAPVAIEGRTLGDGSLTRNVPIDIARQTCADVVIAVAVPTPPPKPEALQSPLVMVSRTLDVLIGANERQQLDTLGPSDVKIIVPMGDIDTGSFDRVADAIPLGRDAAEQHRAELSRYSLSDADYRAWRASRRRPEDVGVEIGAIEVAGLQNVSETYVRSHLGLKPGDHVDEHRLSEAMSQVFDLGDFESVQYTLVGDARHPTLHVDVAEKSLGPNILRFDIGVVMGTEGGNAFVLAADYLRPWINDAGGELHGLLQLGRTSRAQVSLYQPLDDAHDWFVEPGLRLQRSTEDVYVGNNAAARYDLDSGFGFLETGRTFGTTNEVRFGVRSGFQSATREIAVPGLPSVGAEGYGGLTFAYTFDDRDREALATRGWLGRVTYFRGLDALGSAAGDYDRAEGMLSKSMPIGPDLLQLRATGGGTFDGTLPFYDYFVLGGPVSFPGLGIGQLRGTSYWAGSASYLHKIVDINSLFGQSIYAGATLTAGDMSGRIDHVHEAPVFGAAFIVGGRTPLGPMTLSFATTSTADWSMLFTLGRPVEERNIVDADW